MFLLKSAIFKAITHKYLHNIYMYSYFEVSVLNRYVTQTRGILITIINRNNVQANTVVTLPDPQLCIKQSW